MNMTGEMNMGDGRIIGEITPGMARMSGRAMTGITLPGALVECSAGCGQLAVGELYCGECARIGRELEARRRLDTAQQSSFVAPPAPMPVAPGRIQLGVVDQDEVVHPELFGVWTPDQVLAGGALAVALLLAGTGAFYGVWWLAMQLLLWLA